MKGQGWGVVIDLSPVGLTDLGSLTQAEWFRMGSSELPSGKSGSQGREKRSQIPEKQPAIIHYKVKSNNFIIPFYWYASAELYFNL